MFKSFVKSTFTKVKAENEMPIYSYATSIDNLIKLKWNLYMLMFKMFLSFLLTCVTENKKRDHYILQIVQWKDM